MQCPGWDIHGNIWLYSGNKMLTYLKMLIRCKQTKTLNFKDQLKQALHLYPITQKKVQVNNCKLRSNYTIQSESYQMIQSTTRHYCKVYQTQCNNIGWV